MRPYPMRFGTKRKTFSVFQSSLNDFSNSDMVDLKKEKSHNLIISQCLSAGYSSPWSRLGKHITLKSFLEVNFALLNLFSETYKISWTIVTVIDFDSTTRSFVSQTTLKPTKSLSEAKGTQIVGWWWGRWYSTIMSGRPSFQFCWLFCLGSGYLYIEMQTQVRFVGNLAQQQIVKK